MDNIKVYMCLGQLLGKWYNALARRRTCWDPWRSLWLGWDQEATPMGFAGARALQPCAMSMKPKQA